VSKRDTASNSVQFRIRDEMRVVIADRAVDLAQDLGAGDLLPLPRQARHHVGDLLAEGGGRSGLTVGAGQHRLAGQAFGHLPQLREQGVDLRQQALVAGVLQHQAVGQIVDVLGGAGEMHELAQRGQFRLLRQALLQEVLDRLHVVVGGALDLLDAAGVRLREFPSQRVQVRLGGGLERRHFGDARVGRQRPQPADLDDHPVTDQAVLAGDGAQAGGAAGVATIQGRDGG
jgi:glutathione S-transferase